MYVFRYRSICRSSRSSIPGNNKNFLLKTIVFIRTVSILRGARPIHYDTRQTLYARIYCRFSNRKPNYRIKSQKKMRFAQAYIYTTSIGENEFLSLGGKSFLENIWFNAPLQFSPFFRRRCWICWSRLVDLRWLLVGTIPILASVAGSQG